MTKLPPQQATVLTGADAWQTEPDARWSPWRLLWLVPLVLVAVLAALTWRMI